MRNDDDLVMGLLEEALRRPPGERESFLQSAREDSPAAYAEVQELLRWEDRMGDFLREPVLATLERLDHPFEAGEQVAGRFRILKEMGRGGMGVVYEAVDEKLDRRIAIKAARHGFGHRLPPEVRAAREVSHFNVCKVHELHTTETQAGEVEFLVMEFLEGETLAQRIRRAGPLPQREARGIALQLCAGLAQAHRQDVVHGDLKSGNIILTPLPDGGLRAVITDFGLARMVPAEGDGGLMSQQGGTFDYMAPELFTGAPKTAASDLYALGVIFHEMLTGATPAWISGLPQIDEQANTLTVERMPLRARSKRRCLDLPGPWQAVVTRCLEPAPDHRFGSADEIRARLEARGAARKWMAAAVPAAALLVAAAVWWWPQSTGPPVRLAVLPIAVEGAPLPTAAGVAEDVADRLSGVRRRFVVISPGTARRNQVDSPEKAKAALGATHVLRTRLRNSGTDITALASVVDIDSGQVLRELKGSYKVADVSLLAKALTATITGAFQLRAGVPEETVTGAAYPFYVQGINLLRRDLTSYNEAIPLLEKAIALDPRSALPYAGLAEAQLQKYQQGGGADWLAQAGQSVAKAQSLNGDSVPVLLASGLLQQQHGSYEQAVQDFRRAVEVAPNNGDAWNRLAIVYAGMNQPQEALATYQRAIQLQPDYYLNYLRLGNFMYNRGQLDQADELFRRVTALAPGLSAGHTDLGTVLIDEGRFQEAEESLLRALRIEETWITLINLGGLYYQQARYGEAARYFEKTVKVGSASFFAYGDLGDAYRHLGRPEQAAEAYRSARALAGDAVIRNPRDPASRSFLAFVFAQLGDRDRAESEIAQALVLGPGNTAVERDAVLTFETLQERAKSLAALANAPVHLLRELSRQPDVPDLQRDPGFQELLRQKSAQP